MSSEFANVKQDLSPIMGYLQEMKKVRYFPLNLCYFVVCLIVQFSKLLFIRMLQGKYAEAPRFGGSRYGDGKGKGGSDNMTSNDHDDTEDHVKRHSD